MRYLRCTVLSVLVAAPLHNLARPLAQSWDDIRIKHTWNDIPQNWESLGHPTAEISIDLHIALKPHHENALVDALYEVSEPRSPKYGAHLSREQVAQLVAPHPDTLELVYSWLEHHGVPSSSISTNRTHGDSWLTVTSVPVSKANKLLGASYQLYRRTGTNDTTILRTIGYALPAVLHSHVRTVVPTTCFGSMRTLSRKPRRRSVGETTDMASRELGTALSSRDGGTVPSFLRSLYRTILYEPAAIDRNVLGVAGFLKSYPSPADLKEFMTKYRANAVDAAYKVKVLNGGGYDPEHPDGEANLNMQYAQAMAYPTPHIFYSIGNQTKKNKKPARGDVYLELVNYLKRQPTVPQTLSIPYGGSEKDFPKEYADAVCTLFAELGTRGVSIIFPSGDDGVGEGDCKAGDGSGRVQFVPEFPASCPFVTSVGGTTGRPEVAAKLSGGGFSNYFPRPPYQDYDVPVFVEGLHGKYDGLYNAGGRGIPDIAAQALQCESVDEMKFYGVDGTSCSVPIVAGIISLLNDFRLSQGRAALGFLNPWLYGEGLPGINDITEGTNPGCGTLGFSATRGWDPVTGLGTPDFLSLRYILILNPMGTANGLPP